MNHLATLSRESQPFPGSEVNYSVYVLINIQRLDLSPPWRASIIRKEEAGESRKP